MGNFASILEDISIVFCHVRQSANKVADVIAKYVASFGWSSGSLSRATIFNRVANLGFCCLVWCWASGLLFIKKGLLI